MRDFSVPIFLAGLARVLIWTAGAGLAYHRKRWAVCAGFSLAACNAVIFSFVNAHAHLPNGLVDTASVFATPIAGLIVFGYIAAQPRGARRPDKWTP